MKRLFAIVMAAWFGCALAQVPAPADKTAAVATKLEAFSARSGIVVIKGFSSLGTIPARSASLEVQARELRDGANPKAREFGIVAEVTERERLSRSARAFVDLDEVESLLKGIDYITKVDKSASSMKDFEVEYRTKGGLEVSAFTYEGQIRYAVSVRHSNITALIDAGGIETFRKKVLEAKGMLEAVRSKN